ncbi:MAG: MarR family winged helix-turn-helix transcriptional regulator, partial [Actinomycetota bacterium]
FNVLMELAAAPDGSLPLSELAKRLLRSPPNMTTLMDRLEEDGWVRRVRTGSDRRIVLAELTKEGWDALAGAAPLVFATEKRLLACLSEGRRRELARTLDRISSAGVESRHSRSSY